MKTLNRPSASHPYQSQRGSELVNELTTRVRSLWSEPLAVSDGEEREALITSLGEVDIALERLTIRSTCGLLQGEDAAEIERCREHVDGLEGAWGQNSNVPSAGEAR